MGLERGETIICSVDVRDVNNALYSPSAGMKITITNPSGTDVVDDQAMTNTGGATGKYHYDWQAPADAVTGTYEVEYVATDGTRITKQIAHFDLT